jgi:transcriptional regulator with XRE-family HTH domain
VAEQIGVCTATLSLVERGLRAPTADELRALRKLYARSEPAVRIVA